MGWLAHRKFQLGERLSRYREAQASVERFDAILSYEGNRRSAELLARELPQFKPEFQRKFLRVALEQPNNSNLEPLRDALNSFPLGFQKEMRGTADLALSLVAMVRDLTIRRDYETIGRLVIDHLPDFPVLLQSDLDGKYTKDGNKASLVYLGRVASGKVRERYGSDETKLQPAQIEGGGKRRWKWLRAWSSGSGHHAK